ncbi:MAG: hypothetical protein R6V34_08415 [Bacteroidales bacterium]
MAPDNEQNTSGTGNISGNKMQYLQKKEDEKKLRKKRKELAVTEKKIEEMEKAKEEMDNKMDSEPGAISNPDFFGEYEKVNKMIRAEMKIWESLSLEIERFREKTEANG